MIPSMVHRSALAGLLGLGLLAAGAPAFAALGGRSDTVQGDRAHMAATLRSSARAGGTLHEMTLANTAVVREFARPDGVIWAVAWRGPSRPDLRQLLGAHFAAYQAQTARVVGHRMRRPVSVRQSDLVVSAGGRPGGFRGYAYVPALAPAGANLNDLLTGL